METGIGSEKTDWPRNLKKIEKEIAPGINSLGRNMYIS